MEQSSIDRIRTATFAVERRGYDKREVEHFLNRIADWLETGGGDPAREEIVKRELERVGHHTAGLLASAQDGAEQIRAEAEVRAEGTRERADAYALQTREAADRETDELRERAGQEARELVESAEAEARRIVDEAQARRREIETLISDLTAHRDAVAAEATRLADELRDVSTRHTAPAGGENAAETDQPEPAQRVRA
jgi:DivIVA domain-containing protein